MSVERADLRPELANPELATAEAVHGEVVDPADVAALRNRVNTERAELSRTLTELAERFDVKARVRQRATATRDQARSRLSDVGSGVSRPVLDGLEHALRWVADGMHRIGARLRRVKSQGEIPSREVWP